MTDANAGQPRRSPLRSATPVREIAVFPPSATPTTPTIETGQTIPETDEVLVAVRAALVDGFGGVILEGPPGTSKSWYAERIANVLTEGNADRLRMLQFHPSYQYEDFIEGWVPTASGFERQLKHLLLLAQRASEQPEATFVLVIDELSRSDPARVFGEALTYIEQTKRGKSFQIASGETVTLPPNLVVLATMNTFDRGVDEVDAAFDRRLAKIELLPSVGILEDFLKAAGMDPALRAKVLTFFRGLQRLPERHARIGHTYFRGLRTEEDLRRRWQLQLSHVLRKAYRLNPESFGRVEASWLSIFPQQTEDETLEAEGDTGSAALSEAAPTEPEPPAPHED